MDSRSGQQAAKTAHMSKEEIAAITNDVRRTNRPINPWAEMQKPPSSTNKNYNVNCNQQNHQPQPNSPQPSSSAYSSASSVQDSRNSPPPPPPQPATGKSSKSGVISTPDSSSTNNKPHNDSLIHCHPQQQSTTTKPSRNPLFTSSPSAGIAGSKEIAGGVVMREGDCEGDVVGKEMILQVTVDGEGGGAVGGGGGGSIGSSSGKSSGSSSLTAENSGGVNNPNHHVSGPSNSNNNNNNGRFGDPIDAFLTPPSYSNKIGTLIITDQGSTRNQSNVSLPSANADTPSSVNDEDVRSSGPATAAVVAPALSPSDAVDAEYTDMLKEFESQLGSMESTPKTASSSTPRLPHHHQSNHSATKQTSHPPSSLRSSSHHSSKSVPSMPSSVAFSPSPSSSPAIAPTGGGGRPSSNPHHHHHHRSPSNNNSKTTTFASPPSTSSSASVASNNSHSAHVTPTATYHHQQYQHHRDSPLAKANARYRYGPRITSGNGGSGGGNDPPPGNLTSVSNGALHDHHQHNYHHHHHQPSPPQQQYYGGSLSYQDLNDHSNNTIVNRGQEQPPHYTNRMEHNENPGAADVRTLGKALNDFENTLRVTRNNFGLALTERGPEGPPTASTRISASSNSSYDQQQQQQHHGGRRVIISNGSNSDETGGVPPASRRAAGLRVGGGGGSSEGLRRDVILDRIPADQLSIPSPPLFRKQYHHLPQQQTHQSRPIPKQQQYPSSHHHQHHHPQHHHHRQQQYSPSNPPPSSIHRQHSPQTLKSPHSHQKNVKWSPDSSPQPASTSNDSTPSKPRKFDESPDSSSGSRQKRAYMELQERVGEELERKVASMTPHGVCEMCGDKVIEADEGVQTVDSLFHRKCFTCTDCQRPLDNKKFYSHGGKFYCQEDYLYTGFQQAAHKCHHCGHFILEMMLEAVGKKFHPTCFRCKECGTALDGVPFTVDSGGSVYCLNDYHQLFAPKCAKCNQPILPNPGSEETVRVVAMGKDYHIDCYICEGCGVSLTDEEDKRCYPIGNTLLCRSCHGHWARTGSQAPITDL